MNVEDRFWSKVNKTDTCWLWTAGIGGNNGYGKFHYEGKDWFAHRWLFWKINGYLPEAVMHKCDNPICVRPDHLVGGTLSENTKDKIAKGRDHNSTKTHCPQGHEYSSDNTGKINNERYCKSCRRAYAHIYYHGLTFDSDGAKMDFIRHYGRKR